MKGKTNSAGSISLQPRWRVMNGKKIALGPGKADLLQLVAKTGSIGEAAERMEMSYMRAWSLIKTMNACFKKPVIESSRGGREHGGAELTETGRKALALYRKMEQESLRASQSSWKQLQPLLSE
jgi:molybdate transport system regulatory protein